MLKERSQSGKFNIDFESPDDKQFIEKLFKEISVEDPNANKEAALSIADTKLASV
jgi:hypothetical protein